MGYSPPLSWAVFRSFSRLEAAMREKNLSGRELSKLAGTSPQTISQLRHGIRRRVHAHLAYRIEAVLGVEPGELFRIDKPDAGQDPWGNGAHLRNELLLNEDHHG